MSNDTIVGNDPAAIIAQGLADLAELKEEVSLADASVEDAKQSAEAAIAFVTEEQDAIVAGIAAEAETVRERYDARIRALVDTKWATPAALAEMGHSLSRPRRKK